MGEGLIADYGWLIAGMLAAGCATGFAAGLFGIGGGIITVPVLYAVFHATGVGEDPSLKSAIGTSLAVIIVTSIGSLLAHHRAGHVDLAVLRSWAPWIAAGSAFGGAIARFVPVEALAAVFVGGAFYIGARRLAPRKTRSRRSVDLQARHMKIPWGLGAGVFSSLMGLGGGAVGVMAMTLAGRPMHQAIATSAGFGLAVAVPGALGFIVTGWTAPGLPALSAGYVNLPAFAAVAATAGVAAPLGARVAHLLDATLLSRIFAIYVFVAAISIAIDIFG
ncbi:MAG: sulfite exporter TauE/SafE family protein [Pseudomonadota bacterium]